MSRDAPQRPAAPGCIDDALDTIDRLIAADADLPAILARVGQVIGRRIGVVTADGAGLPTRREATMTVPIADVGEVWFEDAARLPAAALERLAGRIAVAVKVDALRRLSAGAPPLSTAIDPLAPGEARTSALRRQGLEPTSSITVFAVVAERAAATSFADQLRAHSTSALETTVGRHHLVIAVDLEAGVTLGVPIGARVAHSGPTQAIDAPEAWRLAKLGLRFSRPSRHAQGPYRLEEAALVDADQMGGYGLFAETVTLHQLANAPDLRRLNQFVAETDDDMLMCLEAVAATDSIRRAARHLHLHHNSVTHRVRRAERYLGYHFTAPYGRTRLFLTLVMRRLLESADLSEET